MAYDAVEFRNGLDQGLMMYEGLFETIDVHFARFMVQLSGTNSPELVLASALVSRLSREGHTCVDLNESMTGLMGKEAKAAVLDLPSPEAWISALRSCLVVGGPGEYRPLILDEAGRLYLHRSYENERRLAEVLLRLNARGVPFDEALFTKGLERMFPPDGTDGHDRHKAAATAAVSRGLCVITGGPGTGKTTLVCRIMALLLEQEPHLKIALAAPTGKAARRIEESIQRSLELIDCTPEVKAMIPSEATTIHRLLGFSLGSSLPRHGAGKPLGADVIAIDEASMADLSLMSYLAQALKESARLILLGDKNQLASVQAGYVLGDICDVGGSHAYSPDFAGLVVRTTGCAVPLGGEGGMQDSLVELTRTYRFSKDSAIFALGEAVNSGDIGRSLGILHSGGGAELCWQDLPLPGELSRALNEIVTKGYGGFLASDDIHERFRLFDAFRILSPVRGGPYGVAALNRLIEEILLGAGLIEPGRLHYHGRPVLVTENDYTLRLMNGDIGLIVSEGDDLRACFMSREGSVRKISPLRLPAHETAFAMTVHKSQGSEFDQVLLILPERDSPVLTRELVYTGITRARSAIEIWAASEIFSAAVTRRTQRGSGLNSMLWGRGS
jgi:exodeoxyribonuclease V alpha subunit